MNVSDDLGPVENINTALHPMVVFLFRKTISKLGLLANPVAFQAHFIKFNIIPFERL